jgi:hypothetical protein
LIGRDLKALALEATTNKKKRKKARQRSGRIPGEWLQHLRLATGKSQDSNNKRH